VAAYVRDKENLYNSKGAATSFLERYLSMPLIEKKWKESLQADGEEPAADDDDSCAQGKCVHLHLLLLHAVRFALLSGMLPSLC
jgi:hypothetical protein